MTETEGVGGDDEILTTAERTEQTRLVDDRADPLDDAGEISVDRHVADTGGSRIGATATEQDPKGRGRAGAGGPQEARQSAGREFERQPVESDRGSVALAQIGGDDIHQAAPLTQRTSAAPAPRRTATKSTR